MYPAVNIGNRVFTCSTTGQQEMLGKAGRAMGLETFNCQSSYKEKHLTFEAQETANTLEQFIKERI